MKKPMICPACGVEMNHHANKINYSAAAEEPDVFDEGLLEEVHSCPNCGRTETRPADVESEPKC